MAPQKSSASDLNDEIGFFERRAATSGTDSDRKIAILIADAHLVSREPYN